MGFKKLRGVRLAEEKQGLIRYTCLNYAEQPKKTQEKIQRLCKRCGGAYGSALFEVMTTKKSITQIAIENHVCETVLYERRKRFFEEWNG